MSGKMAGFLTMEIELKNGEIITLWSNLCSYKGTTQGIEELPNEVIQELLDRKLISPVESLR